MHARSGGDVGDGDVALGLLCYYAAQGAWSTRMLMGNGCPAGAK